MVKRKTEKKNRTHFVFCALPPTEDNGSTTVYIGTREDWEKDGCLSDGYSEEERKRVDRVCDKYKLLNLMESTYESTSMTPKQLNEALAKEPDFAYDKKFAAFIKSCNS